LISILYDIFNNCVIFAQNRATPYSVATQKVANP